MRRHLAAILAGSAALTLIGGCSLNTTMVPIRGPLSERRPLPTIDVHATGMFVGTHGDITFTMPNDSPCKGKWAALDGAVSTSGGLIGEYGAEYSSLSSGQPGSGLATCDDGRSVQLEFAHSGTHGVGFAKDSEGNVFRFIF